MGQRGYLMESDEEAVRLDMKTDVAVVEEVDALGDRVLNHLATFDFSDLLLLRRE